MRFRLSITLCLLTFSLYAQEIKVENFSSQPLDLSAREYAVFDANGDACAIIKIRTGLDSLSFSGDLEIRKTEKKEGEYWLWVSPLTHLIDIRESGKDLLKYKLPLYTEESAVYTISLISTLPDRVVIKGSRIVTISAKPKKAEVYVNNAYMGKSPVSISSIDDTLMYEVRKKKYLPVSSFYEIKDKNELFLKLNRDPKANRMFFSIFTGGNKLGTLFYGINVGQIGRTGWYLSLVPSIRNKKYIGTVIEPYTWSNFYTNQSDYIIIMDYNRVAQMTGTSPEGYYFKLKDKNNTFYNHFRIKAGLTQRLFANTFLNAGIGLAESTKYYKIIMVPYTNDTQAEMPLNKKLYMSSKDPYSNADDLSYLALDIGLKYRIYNHYLINFNITQLYKTGDVNTKFRQMTEISLEIGYNF